MDARMQSICSLMMLMSPLYFAWQLPCLTLTPPWGQYTAPSISRRCLRRYYLDCHSLSRPSSFLTALNFMHAANFFSFYSISLFQRCYRQKISWNTGIDVCNNVTLNVFPLWRYPADELDITRRMRQYNFYYSEWILIFYYWEIGREGKLLQLQMNWNLLYLL